MKKNDLIVTIFFICILFLPNIFYWFLKDKMDNNNYENRNLYEKPELVFKDIKNFPKKFENYFNDHLPFKNEIRKTRSKIYANIFGISSSSSVILGADGWLFFTGDTTLTDYNKTTSYSESEKKKIMNSLAKTNDILNNNNIDFYILVIPNKENVYREKLSNVLKTNNKNQYSKTEDLIQYIKNNSTLKIIYPKDALVDAKKQYDTYYKYDTHWNNYGAYLGVIDLMKEIDANFKSNNILIDLETKYDGDLARMNLMSIVSNKEPVVKNFYNDISYNCENASNYMVCNSEGSLYDKNILFVGDSFRTATAQYLAKIYKNSIFVHHWDFNESLLTDNNIDIVIYEFVERYSFFSNESEKIVNGL